MILKGDFQSIQFDKNHDLIDRSVCNSISEALLQNDFNYMTCRRSLTISKSAGCQNCRSLTCSNSDFSYDQS